MICGRPASAKSFKKSFAGGPQASNPLKSDLREARKQLHQLKNKRKEEKVSNKNPMQAMHKKEKMPETKLPSRSK